jgi:tetratricopeptide (TPR) repeat protein
MARSFIHAALTCALLTVAIPAFAQNRDAARADFRAGVEAHEAGDYANAELLFRRSIATYPTAAAYCNLALTYDRTGRIDEAIEAYRECAEHDSSSSGHYGSHATERAAELELEREAEREVAQTDAPPPNPVPPPATAAPQPSPVLAPSTSPPAPTTASYRQRPPESSPSRAFLWLGLTSTILGAVAIVSAAALATSANADADALAESGYPMADGRYLIPEGDRGADTLASAQTKSSASVGLYVAGGILGALGVTFFILQAATSSGEQTVVAVAPLEGGAAITARQTF